MREHYPELGAGEIELLSSTLQSYRSWLAGTLT